MPGLCRKISAGKSCIMTSHRSSQVVRTRLGLLLPKELFQKNHNRVIFSLTRLWSWLIQRISAVKNNTNTMQCIELASNKNRFEFRNGWKTKLIIIQLNWVKSVICYYLKTCICLLLLIGRKYVPVCVCQSQPWKHRKLQTSHRFVLYITQRDKAWVL